MMFESKPQSNHCWFLYCCVSFLLGFSLASVGWAPESYSWVTSVESGSSASWTRDANPTATLGRVESKSDKHQNWQELFDYVYGLIDTTVGVELWRDHNVTGDTLRKHFQEALVTAISSEHCNCKEKGGN